MTGELQGVALVAAAGEGRRMGPGAAKVLRLIHGEPVLVATIRALQAVPEVEAVFLVIPPGEEENFRVLLARYGLAVAGLIAGGSERQYSVFNGLRAIATWPGWRVAPEQRLVAIHDGARPLVAAEHVSQAFRWAQKYGAVGVGVPVKDTIKVASHDGFITETPPRERLWAIQTPQVFRLPLILAAHEAAAAEGFLGTDDCSLLERMNVPVRLLEGSYRNLKITTPEDLVMAEALLAGGEREMRIGQGFDVHRLTPERPLILGGVAIPYGLGLLGHSDADVLVHAIMDALLGAAGLGDIGGMFPDTDPAYKGANSLLLLAQVVVELRKAGYRVGNVDATVIAQRPKLAPYIQQMRANLAEVLGIPPEAVNVKATTTERLGFTGRGEGMAAQAVAVLVATGSKAEG